jgi:predicted nuclease of predicted toxin-antitoxin system
MQYARENDCVVLTHDLDFGDILAATGGTKPSVVQIRSGGMDVADLGALVTKALAHCAEELDAGALVTIDASRARIRLLPLPFRHPL